MDKGEAEVRLAEVEDWLERKEYAERLRRRRLFPLIGAGLLIVVALWRVLHLLVSDWEHYSCYRAP